MRPQHDNEVIAHIVALLRSGVHVAIVTAAGYPGQAERFEQRVQGLLAAFRALRLPVEVTDRRGRLGRGLGLRAGPAGRLPGAALPGRGH